MEPKDIDEIERASQGDKQAMENLVKNNSGLVWSIVNRFKERGYELEDLYQIGTIGLIKSIKKFDVTYEVKLSTYAVPYILGEIKRYIRDDGPIKVSRSIKELAIKIKEIQREQLIKNGKDIKVEEIAMILKISREEVAAAISSLTPVESIYEKAYGEEEDGICVIDRLSDHIDEMTNLTDHLALKEVITTLKDREKQVILLRYFKGKTQTQVANVLGITQVQVSRIEKKVLSNMKMKLAI